MIIVVFATYFYLPCQIHRGTPEQDSLPREDNQEMAETQKRTRGRRKPIFPVEEEDE